MRGTGLRESLKTGREVTHVKSMNRREFLVSSSLATLGSTLGLALPGQSRAQESLKRIDSMSWIKTPPVWLNTVYKHSAEDNVLAALNPDIFFGYFSVCADGQGFGYANTYPSLDGHQLTHALLWLGRVEEALANWEYVKRWQKPSGQLPIMIDSAGKGLYVHWAPGDPLRALGATTLAHNAYALYTHTLDESWLAKNLECIHLSASYLETLVTPKGRVGGAGYYVEVPTRIEWDGVTQCYAVDAFRKTAELCAKAGDPPKSAHWTELAERVQSNFRLEFRRGGHCVEYIHPEKGSIDRHGMTDVDWAAIAVGMLPKDQEDLLWEKVRDDKGFRYGGMPTGISTAPETYEDWEFIPADQFPHFDHRHDLAAMGRVWYLEAWARARRGDVEGLLDGLQAVEQAGKPNEYSWQERYFPSSEGLKPGGPMTYCEYPANLIRITNQFLFGLDPQVDGTLRVAPRLPESWWEAGWSATLRVGAGTLTLQGGKGALSGTWEDKIARKLVLAPPVGKTWKEGGFRGGNSATVEPPLAVCEVKAGARVEFELRCG